LSFNGADITSDGYAEVSLRDAKRADRPPGAAGREGRRRSRGRPRERDPGAVQIEHSFPRRTISVEYPKAEIGKLLVKVL